MQEMALKQEYEVLYGTRYEVRIIVLESTAKVQEALKRLRAGETFIDLAIQMSTDSSRQQGGLLSAFSADDESYPKAIRDQLTKLQPGEVSQPVALGNESSGFALVKLERKIESAKPKFDDVKKELNEIVTLKVQRVEMDQLVRGMMEKANVVVTDNALDRAWSIQKKRFTPTGR